MKVYNYNEISEKTNVPKSTLSKHVSKNKIKGRQIGLLIYFTESQIFQIISGIRPKNTKSHSRKIQVIELYLMGVTGRDIAKALAMSTKLTHDCIREFNESECIVVESKMNYA
jgi:hypothetical protein